MKEIKVSLLTPAEVSHVVALDQICLGGMWKEEAYLREIESDKSTLVVLHLSETKLGIDSRIIGMACLWSIVDEAHITLLGIDPNYRRQGLGQLLLLTLLEDAIARNLSWATLEVNVNNQKAINLYKKFGFEAVGKRKGYYQSTGEDAVVFWLKNLQQPHYQKNLVQWQQELEIHLSDRGYNWH